MRGSAGRGVWAQRGPPSALVPRRAALPALWRERAAAATRPALRPRAGAAVWVACRREPGRAPGPKLSVSFTSIPPLGVCFVSLASFCCLLSLHSTPVPVLLSVVLILFLAMGLLLSPVQPVYLLSMSLGLWSYRSSALFVSRMPPTPESPLGPSLGSCETVFTR